MNQSFSVYLRPHRLRFFSPRCVRERVDKVAIDVFLLLRCWELVAQLGQDVACCFKGDLCHVGHRCSLVHFLNGKLIIHLLILRRVRSTILHLLLKVQLQKD